MQRSQRSYRVEAPGTVWQVPLIVHRAAKPGPVVMVVAGVHGDECSGTGAVLDLDAWLPGALLRGAVVLVPSANPGALSAGTRGVPIGQGDLNRSFPGRLHGDAAERLAYALWQEIAREEVACLVDLHADAQSALPYVIVDRVIEGAPGSRGTLERQLAHLADATGLLTLREFPEADYVRHALERSLAGAVVNKLGLPAITVEVGPRRFVDPEARAALLDAVRGVLADRGLVDEAYIREGQGRLGPRWRRTAGPRPRVAGLWEPAVRVGANFEAGQVLGHLRALDGAVLEAPVAASSGLVVGWSDRSWVAAGSTLGTLAVPEGEVAWEGGSTSS